MSGLWVLWVGSNIAVFPALLYTGSLHLWKLLAAARKIAIGSNSHTAEMLAFRNYRVALGSLIATGLFLAADLAMIIVGANHYGLPFEPWIAYGTFVVDVALVIVMAATYVDLTFTEKAADVAEREKKGGG